MSGTRARHISETARQAKAYASIDLNGGVGGIPSLIGSNLNVSSLTDGTAGSCTVNLETAMSDTYYAVVCATREIDGITNTFTVVSRNHTTSTFLLVNSKYNNATTDLQISFVVFGDH